MIFIQQGHFKLINAVFLNRLLIKEFWKTSNHHIRKISEGSYDT